MDLKSRLNILYRRYTRSPGLASAVFPQSFASALNQEIKFLNSFFTYQR